MGNYIFAGHTIKLYFTIAFLCSCLTAAAQYNSIFFNNAGINQGLSQSSVVDIAFDSKGFAWLATQDGLNRYDGKDFLTADKKFDDITSGFYNKLGKVVPADGNFLWIISKGGCLERFNLSDGTFTPVIILLANIKQVITCLLADDDGKLWIGTAGGKLILYDSRQAKVTLQLDVPFNNNRPAINALYKDHDNRLWILGSTLCRLENGSLQKSDPVNEAKTISYSCMSEDAKGNLWVGSWGNGIFLKRKNEHNLRQFNGYNSKEELSSSLVIETMLTDHTGKTWFGTYGDGLFIADDNTASIKQLVNNKRNLSSLPFNDVLCIKQDANQGIWIGTDGGGVSYYNENRSNFILFNNQTVPQNVDVALIRSITTDKNDNVWVGTTNNGLTEINYLKDVFKTWHFTSYKKNIYNPDRIVSLFTDNQNILWVGTQGNGLLLFDPVKGKTVKWYHPEATATGLSIPDATVWCMYPAGDDSVWIGTGSTGLCLLNKRRGIVGTYTPANNADAIRAIVAINDSTLGIGFEKTGISFFNTRTKTFHAPPSAQINTFFNAETNIKCLYYRQPFLWIGTGGTGIVIYNTANGKIDHLKQNDGLPNNTIYGILPGEDGYLWVSTNKGLSRFNQEIINRRPTPSLFTNYTSASGLQSNEFNTGAYCRDSNGTLLFGGINGLNLFNPAKFLDEDKAKPVVFTKILIDNEPVGNENAAPFKKEVNLSAQNHSIAFNFAALVFFAPLQFHYYYKLDGYDKTWIDANQRTYVSYTNVPEGKYSFLVKYIKQGNIDHAAISQIGVNITGPVYKKRWFVVMLILLALVSFYGVYRVRLNQVLKLLQIRQRIATDLHDDIGSTLSNINILSELSKKSIENPPQARIFLNRISEEVQSSSQSLDDIIWSINVHNDNWEETFSRMRRYAAEFFENTGTNYTMTVEEHTGITRLKMDKRRDVFLIYKELLNNIHKHAAATDVQISMHFNEQRLIMEIADNGKGFDKTRQTHRNGLKSLNDRVARWKGTISIETGKNGTHIHIAI